VDVKLYAMGISHPSQAARKMLDLKGVDYKLVDVLPLNQRLHLRLAGFRDGTVPALKVDGRRIQGSREIARAVDRLWPEPPLFPPEPMRFEKVVEAERWGEERLQPIPRRLLRYGASYVPWLRRELIARQPFPAPAVFTALSVPLIRYYARSHEHDGRLADEDGVRTDLAQLPFLIDKVDELLADGTLSLEPPNAATLQILSTVRVLNVFGDLHDFISSRPCAQAAHDVFPRYPTSVPRFLRSEWLGTLAAA
jgi:glutathione S-transferase